MTESHPLIPDTYRIHCDQKPESPLCLRTTRWHRGKLHTQRQAAKHHWFIFHNRHTCPFCLEAIALALQQAGISNPHTAAISPPAPTQHTTPT